VLPDWYLDEPEIDQLGVWLLQAFGRLHTCRRYVYIGANGGVAHGPIPYDAVQTYAKEWGLDREWAEALAYVVSSLDDALCEWHSANAPKAPKQHRKREDLGG